MSETGSTTDAAPASLERVASFASFATIGVLRTTQDIAHAVIQDIDGIDPDLAAEETLCLVSTATARAAGVGLEDEPEQARTLTTNLLELPYLYRDYLIGSAMIARQDASLAGTSEEIHERLDRKMQFYTTHLPQGDFPGQHALTDKMGLWMGRVSPPKLPEKPQDRLEKLDLVPVLLAHLKLILARGRRSAPADR